MAWEISKDFDIEYGHRVHAQTLDPELSLSASCKCRRLHGHSGKVSIYLGGEDLNASGMIMDFTDLAWFKQFLDDTLDHKFIIDSNDPVYAFMLDEEAGFETIDVVVPGTEWVVGKTVNLDDIEDSSEKEYFESFFIVDFVPTSENLAQWAWKVAQCRLIEHDIYVTKVVWSETAKSKATYFHVEKEPDPEPATPEEIAATEEKIKKMGDRWTPPPGGFDLYGAKETRGKKK